MLYGSDAGISIIPNTISKGTIIDKNLFAGLDNLKYIDYMFCLSNISGIINSFQRDKNRASAIESAKGTYAGINIPYI
jgi:hypothetical protein